MTPEQLNELERKALAMEAAAISWEAQAHEAERVRDLAREASNRDLEAKRQAERELAEERARYRWRPIDEIHEDYGLCVLIDIEDPAGMMVGSRLDEDFEEGVWTHFSRIARLSHEDAARMKTEADAARKGGTDAE